MVANKKGSIQRKCRTYKELQLFHLKSQKRVIPGNLAKANVHAEGIPRCKRVILSHPFCCQFFPDARAHWHSELFHCRYKHFSYNPRCLEAKNKYQIQSKHNCSQDRVENLPKHIRPLIVVHMLSSCTISPSSSCVEK